MALVFYDSGDGRRITRGEEVSVLAALLGSPFLFSLCEFPSEEIETGHPLGTAAIRSEITEHPFPLNVRQIGILGTPSGMIAAVGKKN